MLDERTANSTSKQIEIKITVSNTPKWFFISKLFSLKKVFKASLGIIERWFTTVANLEDFLELDFTLVATVLNSSELLIDSELQVFNVVNAWLNHKSIERSKHAKYLLQRVRLSLLTVPALNSILDKYLWIVMNDECSKVIKKIIEYKNKLPFNFKNNLPISRHCSQNNFKFVVVGGRSKTTNQVVRDAFTIDGSDFLSINSLPIINYGRYRSKIICIKGEIYVFGGFNVRLDQVMPVEKYSPATNTWYVIKQMYDKRSYFCACSFIEDIYVFGGLLKEETSSCLVFNTINKTWKEIAFINVARQYASCVVFEGRIVVSGGHNAIDGTLNTVESYDHIDNSWKHMPKMVEERYCHKSVAIKNKLFMIGGLLNTSVEVFDSCSNKFVLLKYNSANLRPKNVSDITTLGNRILIFNNNNGSVLIYDVEDNEWEEKSCEATQDIKYFSCAKVPHH